MIDINDAAFETMVRTVYGEARGEDYKAQVAVAWVIRNRAASPSWWGTNIKEVCLKPKQFSCWDDHNRIALLSATIKDRAFRSCLRAALEVVEARPELDPTMGADHYHSRKMSKLPPWARDQDPVAVIGGHSFYRLRSSRA